MKKAVRRKSRKRAATEEMPAGRSEGLVSWTSACAAQWREMEALASGMAAAANRAAMLAPRMAAALNEATTRTEAPPYTYSDEQRSEIEPVLPRVGLFAPDNLDPEMVSFRNEHALTNMDGLMNTLAQAGCVVALTRTLRPALKDPLRFFMTKANQFAEFRRQLGVTLLPPGQVTLLPPGLHECAVNALGELELIFKGIAVALAERSPPRKPYKIPRSQNAGDPEFDLYFLFLIHVWVCIGGKLGRGGTVNTEPIRQFIGGVAQYVLGEKAASKDAVEARLKGLKTVKFDDVLAPIPTVVLHRWALAWQLIWPSRGQTKRQSGFVCPLV